MCSWWILLGAWLLWMAMDVSASWEAIGCDIGPWF